MQKLDLGRITILFSIIVMMLISGDLDIDCKSGLLGSFSSPERSWLDRAIKLRGNKPE